MAGRVRPAEPDFVTRSSFPEPALRSQSVPVPVESPHISNPEPVLRGQSVSVPVASLHTSQAPDAAGTF